jgi:tricorn protease-like protein
MIYAAAGKNVYVYSATSKALVDSFVSTKLVMNLYRHPAKQELWAVHHFNDSVTVFKESDRSVIASFDIGNDPFFLAFAPPPTAISDVYKSYDVQLYPNPVANRMTWVLPGGNEQHIILYDYQGRVVKTVTTTIAKTEMDVTNLQAGNYIGAVYIQGTLVKALPFIKE